MEERLEDFMIRNKGELELDKILDDKALRSSMGYLLKIASPTGRNLLESEYQNMANMLK